MAALDKAKEILSGGVKEMMFLQQKVATRVVRASSVDARDMLVHKLRKLGRKFNSFGLMQLAGRATSDPFVKIRGMIDEMIAKLQKEAQEEATQEAFCQEEKA